MNVAHFIDRYQATFHEALSQPQEQGLEILLGLIQADRNMQSLHWRAYLLATVKHECDNRWRPITEYGSRDYLIDRYWENEKTRLALGNREAEDAVSYRGHGYVQITGRRNFYIFSGLTGVDLIEHPERALEPSLAYQIASIGMRHGKFTGKALAEFIDPDAGKLDYYNARRVVNGTDKAALIAAYALTFQLCLHHAQ